MSSDRALDGFIDSVLPVLLVGGRSRRFGRDKLLEPIPGGDGRVLMDLPLAVLRAVFGPRVLGVGACAPAVAARLDRHIEDQHPGAGPAAGILAALRNGGGDGDEGAKLIAPVFVLAGDMPHVTAPTVRRIAEQALKACRHAAVVLARTHELQPCFGVYFSAAAGALERGLAPSKPRALHEILAELAVVGVAVEAGEAGNVNTVAELRGEPGPGGGRGWMAK